MTTYSVMGSSEKVAVIATWSAVPSDLSAKVTTAERETAEQLAVALSVASEAAWFAGAWLDTWAPTRDYLRALASWARTPSLPAGRPRIDTTACRHDLAFCTADAEETLSSYLPSSIGDLSHTQRLAVADEIDRELDSITTATKAAGTEPGDDDRGWQFAEVTRAWHYGLGAYLPEAAPAWARSYFHAETPLQRWAARGLLLRLEQMTEACRATEGRTGLIADPRDLEAHLAWGSGGDARVVVARPEKSNDGRIGYHWASRMEVWESRGHGRRELLGTVDPYDTDSIVALLGDWVLAVPMAGA